MTEVTHDRLVPRLYLIRGLPGVTKLLGSGININKTMYICDRKRF